MSNVDLQNDPYAIDHEKVKHDNEKKEVSGNKVKWHNLPAGDGMSYWRILPFIQKRSFFFKVTKHWLSSVPGMKGSVTCPRSFDDPDKPGKKLPCAICDKFFEMYKSTEPGDQEFAKLTLKKSDSYYVNAVNMEKTEDGVGVLNIPYSVFKTLMDWLDVPKFREFAHPVRGRAFMVKASSVAGSQIPGQPGKQKREYSVIPDDPGAITNQEWLSQLYDLEKVLGIPTYELTQSYLAKLMTNDAKAGELPPGTTLYRGQLTEGSVPATNVAPPEQITTVAHAHNASVGSTPPAFANTPTQSTLNVQTVPGTSQTTTTTAVSNEDAIRERMKAILNKPKQ